MIRISNYRKLSTIQTFALDLNHVYDALSWFGGHLCYVIWKSSKYIGNYAPETIFPNTFSFYLSMWPWPWTCRPNLYPWHIVSFAKWYKNWSKGVEVMLRKQVFHLTMACDLDQWHSAAGLLLVMLIVFLLLSYVVSWFRCGTWLYRFLIFAVFLTYIPCKQIFIWPRIITLYVTLCPF